MTLKELFRFGDQRRNYWSCSAFAHWVTKTFGQYEKPLALELDAWDTWEKKQREDHPVVYWFTESFLSFVQNLICYPLDVLDRVRYYFVNRFVDKTHYLPTKLTPGQWYDLDTVLLNAMFEGLVDFVEVEKAHIYMWTLDDKSELPLVYRHSWLRPLRWTRFRSREMGMKYLEWEMNLEDGGAAGTQSSSAREIVDLYTWWKNVRPARKDPYEVSGWSVICETNRGLSFTREKKTDEEQQKTIQALEMINKLEAEYEKEDEDMMIRLIKVRRALWT